MTTRTRAILGWTPHVLIALFLIIASAAPKLFMSGEGSSLQPFGVALGVWDIIFYIGLLELACAVLLLIPRTTTIGFVLSVGLLGGAMSTAITHPEVEGVWPWFPLLMLLIICIGSYFRSPELLSRVLKRPVPAVSKTWKIVGWIAAILVAGFHIMSMVGKIMPVEPGSVGDLHAIQVGMRGLEMQLAILQLIVLIPFLIPRTSTLGFILMVGYWAGVLAANLTHGVSHMEAIAFYVLLVLLTVSAYGRNRELISRLLGHKVPEKI